MSPYNELKASLNCLYNSVINDRLLSTFEFSISKVVEALLSLLLVVRKDLKCSIANVFKKVSIF